MNTDDIFKDNRLSAMDKNKLNLLKQLTKEINSLKPDEKLPFFMALSQSSVIQDLHFTKEESKLLMEVLQDKELPPEMKKVQTLLQFFNTDS